MTDLIERLEAASGPSRELDVEIARLQNAVVLRRKWDDSGNEEFTHWHYTASINAALTLVPIQNGPWSAWNWAVCHMENAATPALALCIAALRAREADRG